MDFVGWFTTAGLSEETLRIHNVFASLNPLPILLVLDPSGLSASHSEALPIKVYESIPSAGGVELGEVEFRLETGEAERIGVEHVSKAQKKGDSERTDADECISPPKMKVSCSGECFANSGECDTHVAESYRDYQELFNSVSRWY